MKIIVLGAPGVGKGTYTKLLVKRLNLPHVNTGDLFRDEMTNQTELGKLAKLYVDKGQLVPDDVTTGILKKKLAEPQFQNGFFLDGYPRTLEQAKLLEGFAEIDKVLNFIAREDVIIDRLSGRRICRKCGEIYHIRNIPPPKEGTCKCGGELYQREDDKPEAIKQRLEVYANKTAPLVQYYNNKGLLVEVDVNSSYEERESVLQFVDSVLKR